MPDVDLKINQSWEVLNQRFGFLLVCLLCELLLPKFNLWVYLIRRINNRRALLPLPLCQASPKFAHRWNR